MITQSISFALMAISIRVTLANWCDLESCQGAKHIDCTMGNGKFGADCPDNAVMLNLRNAQTAILKKFNEFRNKVAGGLVENLEPATRMGKLRWNVSLANLCRKNIKQCANPGVSYDECRNTPDFDFVGQNLAFARFPATEKHDNLDILLKLIDFWNSECEKATAEDLAVFPGTGANGDVIAQCTQNLKMYATRVGCAGMAMWDGDDKIIHMCCNFDSSNVLGWPIYDAGEAASKCAKKDTTYKNLCSADEVYNVNAFWEDYAYIRGGYRNHFEIPKIRGSGKQ